jgi:hypothetical protein
MLQYRLRQIEALLHRISSARLGTQAPAPRQLQTPQDILDLLHEQVEAIRSDVRAGPLEKARAIGYLAGLAHRAIETGTMAQRIEMLEAVLQNRKGKRQS